MKNDLIERLKGPFNYAPRKKGEPHYLKVPENLIEEVTEALSAPMDEDVERVTKGIRESFCRENEGCGPMPYCLCAIAEEGVGLIERLERENELIKISRNEQLRRASKLSAENIAFDEKFARLNTELKLAQQRIKELEQDDAMMQVNYRTVCNACAELHQRIKELESENSYLLDQVLKFQRVADIKRTYHRERKLLQRQLDEALRLIERVIECYEDGIVGDTPSSGLVILMKNLLENGVVRIREMKDE